MKEISGYDEAGSEFTERCKNAKIRIFKLGVLDDYAGEDASDSWLTWRAEEEGYVKKSMQLMHGDLRYIEWMQFCRSNAPMTRLQIVKAPLTPYAEWQLAIFREYEKPPRAEHVRIVSEGSLGKLVIPDSDIVIFDDESVLQWTYVADSDGKVNGAVVLEASGGDDIGSLLTLRDNLLERSVPLV